MRCDAYLHHRRIFPEAQLILAKAVAREDLALVPVPLQTADLRVRIDAIQHRTRVGIPELDAPVSCASSRCQQISLERAPCERLDGGLVRVDAMERLYFRANVAAASTHR